MKIRPFDQMSDAPSFVGCAKLIESDGDRPSALPKPEIDLAESLFSAASAAYECNTKALTKRTVFYGRFLEQYLSPIAIILRKQPESKAAREFVRRIFAEEFDKKEFSGMIADRDLTGNFDSFGALKEKSPRIKSGTEIVDQINKILTLSQVGWSGSDRFAMDSAIRILANTFGEEKDSWAALNFIEKKERRIFVKDESKEPIFLGGVFAKSG